MESNKIREEFAISIRRKQKSNKIEALRAMYAPEVQNNIVNHEEIFKNILQKNIPPEQHLHQLKIISYQEETAKKLFETGIHRIISQRLLDNKNMSDSVFRDILTILINLCVHANLDISNECMQQISLSICNKNRQMLCLWLIANIVYQNVEYSFLLAKELIKDCGALTYIERRINQKFQNQVDIITFNFFLCSFLTVSSALAFSEVKRILASIQQIHQFEAQKYANLIFFSEALIEHASQMAASDHIVLQSPLMNLFADFCKEKKTLYIKNYLKMLVALTQCDGKAYEKMLNLGIFRNLDFCLENRFPQVKGLCAEIGINLIDKFEMKVDLQNIGFFAELSTAFLNFEKYSLPIQISLLKYSYRFFRITASNKSAVQDRKRFIEEIVTANIVSTLGTLIVSSHGQFELIVLGVSFLGIFIECDPEDKVKEKCQQEKIIEFLEQLGTQNQQLIFHIDKFLAYFPETDSSNSMMMN